MIPLKLQQLLDYRTNRPKRKPEPSHLEMYLRYRRRLYAARLLRRYFARYHTER